MKDSVNKIKGYATEDQKKNGAHGEGGPKRKRVGENSPTLKMNLSK